MNASNGHGGWVNREDENSSIYETMGECHSPELLWETVLKYLESFNVKTVHYYHLPPIGAHDVDIPFQIRQGQCPERIKSDSIVFFDLKQSFIFKFRSLNHFMNFQKFSDYIEHMPEQYSLFRDIHRPETESGFIFPCHSANGRTGVLIIETEQPHDDYDDSTLRLISHIALAAHNFYCDLKKAQSRPLKHLTSREKEILTWVAYGKSNSVIADIIGISQHTVNGYLRSIYLKTNTSDRTTAVLRGLGDGLIDL